jgi:general secretion pathway protein A
MYLEYYGLLKEPFHITPDPDFLYMSPSHREAFAALVYGVEQRKGFIAMTGEVGAGKTTILRAFTKRVDANAVRPVYLFNPALTFHELLIMTMRGLGLTPDMAHSAAELLDQLNWALIEEYRAGHNVVLLVDEAQNMPVETLEQMRMLSNLETANDKLLQIVLVGQPELEDKLNLHELRQLKQRCAVRSIVKPLTRDESAEYIKHRLHMAGCPRDEVFSPAALRAIISNANGSPRTLNILCDNAMIAGFGSQQTLISAAIVRSVIRDMGATSRSKPQAPRWAWGAAIAAGGIIIGAVVSQVGLLGGPAATGNGVITVEASAGASAPAAAPVQAPPAPEAVQVAAVLSTPTPEVVAPAADPKPSAVESVAVALKQREDAKRAEEPKAAAPVEKAEAPKPVEAAKPVDAAKPAAAPKPIEVAAPKETAKPAVAPAPVEAPKPVQLAKNEPEAPQKAEPVILDGPADAEVPKPAAAPVADASDTSEQSDSSDTPASAPAPAPAEPAPAPEPAPALAEGEILERRIVAQGDVLSRLAAEVYGSGHPQVVRALHRYNPQIANPDQILPGQTVVFPAAVLVGAETAAGSLANSANTEPAGGANP